MGYFSFRSAQEALQQTTLNDLSAARDRGREHVVEYLKQASGDVGYHGKTPAVQSAFKTLSAFLDYALYLDYAKSNPAAPVDVKSEEFARTVSEIDPMFKRFLENFESERGYQDILLIVGNDLGLVLYSSKRLSDLGTSLKSGALKDTNLGRLWEKVIKTRKPAMVDFAKYAPAGTVSAFIGVPGFPRRQRTSWSPCRQVQPDRINEIVMANAKKGTTGDSFIVGQDLLLRTNSRQRGAGLLETKVDTKATQEGTQGKTGVGEMPGPPESLSSMLGVR